MKNFKLLHLTRNLIYPHIQRTRVFRADTAKTELNITNTITLRAILIHV